MEKVVSPDSRWSWVEVNLAALRRNTQAFRRMLSRDVQMMCVVKADAYGHGAVPCAKTMHAAGANQFAVATVREGVALREAGIGWPILILSEVPPWTALTRSWSMTSCRRSTRPTLPLPWARRRRAQTALPATTWPSIRA